MTPRAREEAKNEPIFNIARSKDAVANSKYLHAWMQLLVNRNTNMERKTLNYFRSKNFVKFIFKLCNKFNQPDSVKFNTIDIFNTFMINQFDHMFNFLKSKKLKVNEFNSDWKCIIKRAKHQLILRIVSCMQISSKFGRNSKIMKTNEIIKWLRKINLNYKADSICKSEIRVLSSIDYKINNPSAYDNIEGLVEVLVHKDENFDADAVFGYSVKLLQYFYFERREIYKQLKALIFNPMKANRIAVHEFQRKFKLIEGNLLLASASIVACAQYLLNCDYHEHVLQELSSITGLSQDDIMVLASVIMQCILQ